MKQNPKQRQFKVVRGAFRLLLGLFALALVAACSSPVSNVLNLSAGDIVFETDEVSKTLVLRNSGDPGSSLNWSASVAYEGAASGWLNLTPASGSTPGGGASTLTLAADRAGLAPGEYRARLHIRSDGGNAALNVLVRVATAPQPQLDGLAENVEFAADEESVLLAIRNAGEEASVLNWQIRVNYGEGPSDWLSIDPDRGTTPGGGRRTATLSVNRSGLAPGTYRATLEVTSNGGNGRVAVVLNVEAPQPIPTLSVAATAVDFGVQATSRTLSIGNTGEPGSVLQWSTNISYGEGAADWLSVNPPSGTVAHGATSSVTLSASRENLAPGSYEATLNLSSNGGGAAITVRLTVETPNLTELTFTLSPTSLAFGGSSNQALFTLTNTHPRAITWTASGDAPWLSLVNPSSAERGEPLAPGASDSVQVLVNRSGLAPGAYQTTITVLAADSVNPGLTRQQTVAVSMQVPAAEPPATASISGRVTTANAAIPITTAAQGEAADGFSSLASEAPTGPRPAYAPGELLVRYRTDGVGTLSEGSLYTQSVRTLADDFNLSVLRTGDPGLPDVVALPPGVDAEAAARRLEQDPRVLSATPNYYVYSQSVPNDPQVREQWALAASGLPAAWGRETGGTSRVVVAVIDSGFALNHPDLAGRFLPGYDFCAVPGCGTTDNNPTFGETQNFHGTHVAGIIGAIGGNGVGVAGAAHGGNLRLLPIKVYPDDGSAAPISALIDALNYAVGIPVTTRDGRRVSNPNPARIINMSLGGDFEMPFALQEAINNARTRGALVVVATGNDGAGRVQSPAAADGVLGVGAHNQAFTRSCFSNYGQGGAGTFGPGGVDILAPGGEKFLRCRSASQGLLSTVPGNAYSEAIGTSMAAPMVAGVAALILSREPALSVSQLESRLLGSAYFDRSTMTRTEYGAGILRADRALGLAGPGDTVTVVAAGPGSAQATVTLDLFGGSSSYTLRNLRAGAYTVSAGQQGGLFGQRQVSVSDGQSLSGQDIGVRATP